METCHSEKIFVSILFCSYLQHISKSFCSTQNFIAERFRNVFCWVWTTWKKRRKRENKIQNIKSTKISNKSSISLSAQLKSYFILSIWLLLTLLLLAFGTGDSSYAFWTVQIVPLRSHVRNLFLKILQLVLSRSLWSNNISEKNLSAKCERNN